ncbi:hypothetical protein Btru_049555 [Bulinus truncatus]|nr:hypothetical protein Btru_049555 [Bulinus truncatus]
MSKENEVPLTKNHDSEKYITSNYNISWFKLAVAVAIIRSKPANISSKKHAEELRALYLHSQNRLQDHYAIATKQIEELKGILAKIQFTRVERSNDGLDKLNIPLMLSGDHLKDGKSGLLTAIPNSIEASFVENLHFIQSVISLQNLTHDNAVSQTEHSLETAVKAIKIISEVVQRNVVTVSETCLCQAACNVNSLIDTFQWLQERPSFMREVCLLAERIVNQLFLSTEIEVSCNNRRKQLLIKMLLQLMKGKSLPLLVTILDSLVDNVQTFCQMLHESQALQKLVDPNLFNNGYFLIAGLESIMKQWLEECPVHTAALQETQHSLDLAIQLVTDAFPLVAQALFRVSSLCEIIIQKR